MTFCLASKKGLTYDVTTIKRWLTDLSFDYRTDAFIYQVNCLTLFSVILILYLLKLFLVKNIKRQIISLQVGFITMR